MEKPKDIKEVARQYLKYGFITIVLFGLVLIFISAFSQKAVAEAPVKTLQENVETYQAKYDSTQESAKSAMYAYCTNWVALSKAKVLLSQAMKIETTQTEANPQVCDDIKIPSSF